MKIFLLLIFIFLSLYITTINGKDEENPGSTTVKPKKEDKKHAFKRVRIMNLRNPTKKEEKKIEKIETPIDNMLYVFDAILRGDFISPLIKLVELTQKQDNLNTPFKIFLKGTHRYLISARPGYYLLFPSTKKKETIENNFKSRIKTTSNIMKLFM